MALISGFPLLGGSANLASYFCNNISQTGAVNESGPAIHFSTTTLVRKWYSSVSLRFVEPPLSCSVHLTFLLFALYYFYMYYSVH